MSLMLQIYANIGFVYFDALVIVENAFMAFAFSFSRKVLMLI